MKYSHPVRMAILLPYGFLFASVSGILASRLSPGAFLSADFVTVMWAFFLLKFTKSGLFKVCSEGLFFSLESISLPQKLYASLIFPHRRCLSIFPWRRTATLIPSLLSPHKSSCLRALPPHRPPCLHSTALLPALRDLPVRSPRRPSCRAPLLPPALRDLSVASIPFSCTP